MKSLTCFILMGFLTGAKYSYAQISVLSNNNVGIGMANPTESLHINKSQTRFYYSGVSANFLHFSVVSSDPRIISANKVVFYNPSNTGHIDIEARSFIQISDERLKTNIERIAKPQGKGALAKVLQLNGYSYDWKDGTSQRSMTGGVNNHQIGFLAQEVEKIIPEAVVTADSSGVKAMSYNYIIPYLVEAIKEQQQTIEQLKTLIADRQKNVDPKQDAAILSRKD